MDKKFLGKNIRIKSNKYYKIYKKNTIVITTEKNDE